MKILVVDDHAYNRDLLNFILHDEGHNTVEASHGEEAVDIYLKDTEIDLILMDVNMPVMDGIQATQIIKEKSVDRFVPVIFVTALDDSDNLFKCLDAGGDDFVPKPVNETALIAKIKAHTRTQALYNQLSEAKKTLEYHNQLVEREHSIVEHIFERGSNRISTSCDNVHLCTSPMSMFNGDIVLQAPSPSGGVYTLLGDFTGHGLASSIGTLPVTDIFHSLAATQGSVSKIAEDLNTRLVNLLPDTMFFCAAIGFLDHRGEQLTVWAGGINDILIVRKIGGEVKHIASAHMPIGILPEEEFDDSVELITLAKGEQVYIYSDGINEAKNENDEEFGLDRLEKIVSQGGEDVVKKLTDSVHEFQAGDEQTDDLSLMEIISGEVVHRDKKTNEIVDVGAEYHSAESFPWLLTMKLGDDDLKKTSISSQIMGFVASIQGIEIHQDKIFTIVSELYSNALEHGVLGLDSSLKDSADGFEQYYQQREERLNNLQGHYIELSFKYISGSPNQIELIITDSGQGFDYENKTPIQHANDESHGRGLSLLYSLCASLTYSNGGRTVTAVYDLCR